MTVYLGKDETIFATVRDSNDWVKTSAKFVGMELPWISILPQIGPLLREEYRLTDERIVANLTSRLASRHFRNQFRMEEEFHEFKHLAEETWHGLSVDVIQEEATREGRLLSLPIRDGDFVAEVAGWGTDSKCGCRLYGSFHEFRLLTLLSSMNQTSTCTLICNAS